MSNQTDRERINTMQFEFATATKIIFGPGTLNDIGVMTAGMGRRAFVVTGRIDGDDVCMVQLGRRFCFAFESRNSLSGQTEPGRENLESHPSVKRLLPGLVDASHASPANFSNDREVTEIFRASFSGCQGVPSPSCRSVGSNRVTDIDSAIIAA